MAILNTNLRSVAAALTGSSSLKNVTYLGN